MPPLVATQSSYSAVLTRLSAPRPQSDIHRQNQITQQILTQYLQRRLFPHNHAPPNTNITDKIPNVTDRELDEELESRSSENLGSFYNRGTRSESPNPAENAPYKANWYKASQYCRYHGMHLASIASQDENDKLEKHIRDFGKLIKLPLLFVEPMPEPKKFRPQDLRRASLV
ncbi:uncharacterized protein LOC113470813 [Diaphorina citri]|uniref:Uncharacterized protein LOC113470813 n=1 Tax=Diaphorina citri TaxID=121845 RepID=A0A3Q0JA61_DIACI|nr:uncharacterized protein LOC113470813 [Diaphorina citri]